MRAGNPPTSSLSLETNDLLNFVARSRGLSSFDMLAACLYDKPSFKLCKRRAHVAEDGGDGSGYMPDPGDASERDQTDEQGVLDQILTLFAALQAL
jgi:hypothetical protein